MIERKSERERERERETERGREGKRVRALARVCSCLHVPLMRALADALAAQEEGLDTERLSRTDAALMAQLQEAEGMGVHAVELTSATLAPVLPESQQGDQQGEEHPLMRTDRNNRKHKGPSHARLKQLRFGLQQQRLEQAKAKATELELRLKDWEEVVVELLQQQRDSETEIMDLRASIEQAFGREGGGVYQLAPSSLSMASQLKSVSRTAPRH